VEMSDATLILSLGDLPNESGSMLTAKIARTLGKPCRHAKIGDLSDFAVERLREWLAHGATPPIRTLNVAGPRESREPGIQAAVRAALVRILRVEEEFGWDP
jgi:uncharacterized protein YbjT (DUF2867 family)